MQTTDGLKKKKREKKDLKYLTGSRLEMGVLSIQ
jgi:hypothetical protein